MTLKTTKEQRDALLIKLDDPDFNVYNTITVYNSVVRDLCHDADRARELEKENTELRNIAVNIIGKLGEENTKLKHDGDEFVDRWMRSIEKINELDEENADLRAKLDRYTRIAESGKSYGDDLDNIERIAELEFEATQDALDIERALSGQRLLYNRPLAVRAADLRTKLNAAYERAAQVCEEQICPCCWREDAHLATRQAAAAIRALKEQEK